MELIDTQHIRNAYVERNVDDIGVSYGTFAAHYLGVKDSVLEREFNINAANNYILAKGYNQREGLSWPQLDTSSEQPATTNVAE